MAAKENHHVEEVNHLFPIANTHRIHVCYIWQHGSHQYTPNVSIYTIHGSYGIDANSLLDYRRVHWYTYVRMIEAGSTTSSSGPECAISGSLSWQEIMGKWWAFPSTRTSWKGHVGDYSVFSCSKSWFIFLWMNQPSFVSVIRLHPHIFDVKTLVNV